MMSTETNAQETEFDIGIHCDYLLTMKSGLLRDQFLGITGSKIKLIAPFKSGEFRAKKFIEAKNRVVMPGLINGHTHLPMTLFRGLADDLPFADWLHKYILPLESKLVDETFVRIGTRLAALESIRYGVTTVCDMYYFEDAIAEELDTAGLRALVCEAVADFPAPDDKNQKGNAFTIIEKMLDKYKSNERITVAIGPHAPYSCSDETLKKVAAFSEKNKLPISIHVSETKFEVQDSLKKYGMTPVERLHSLGLMKGRSFFAHCVHITEKDIELMTSTRTAAIYNPESNMKLGSGVAPIANFLKKGGIVGIGTDGAASNNDLNIFREMDSGTKLQKLILEDNTAMTAHEALCAATIDGAKALGIDKTTGSLEVGKSADLIILNLEEPNMWPIHDIESQLVYAATGSEVETVICNGKILMEKNEFKTLNKTKIFSDAEMIRKNISESLK